MHNFLYSLPRHFWPCSAAEYQKLNLFPLTNTMPSVIPCPSPPPHAVHAQTCFYTQSLQVPLATKINLCEIQGKKKVPIRMKNLLTCSQMNSCQENLYPITNFQCMEMAFSGVLKETLGPWQQMATMRLLSLFPSQLYLTHSI